MKILLLNHYQHLLIIYGQIPRNGLLGQRYILFHLLTCFDNLPSRKLFKFMPLSPMCEYLLVGRLAYGEYYHFLDFANCVGKKISHCFNLYFFKTKVWYSWMIFHVWVFEFIFLWIIYFCAYTMFGVI